MNLQNLPFPGLRPYKFEESDLFFGRERHIAEILRKLEAHRFVSVVGNSGSGKSSLVKAGVLPVLIKEKQNWDVCTLRPGEGPIKQMVQSLFNVESFSKKVFQEEELEDIYQTLLNNRLGLVQAIRPHLEKGRKLLILVDQFEELFRFKELFADEEKSNAANHFVDLLLGAIEQNDIPIYVMMTLRSDFLGDCEQFDGLPEAINDGQFLIPRMNREDLKNSITGPVRVVNGKISPRLVEQLLNEIGNNPDQLPILQHVLMRTWEVWKGRNKPEQPMDFDDYESTGMMSTALSNHAEEAFGELKTPEDIRLAEALFRTITMKTSDNRGVRRPSTVQSVADISGSSVQDVIRVATIFRQADRGFIMPPINIELKPNSILDISHESLMRVWGRLKEWVNEEGESAELYERITNNALLYEQEKASLWRNPDLQIALDWKEKQRPNLNWANQYNNNFNIAMRFIEASSNEHIFMLKDKARKRKILMFSSIALLIALSGLTIWALSERTNAQINAENAIAEKAKTEEQARIAQINFEKAKEEERKAQLLQLETEEQRKLAVLSSEEAQRLKVLAQLESTRAITAKQQAEKERLIAKSEKLIADKLRIEAESSEKKTKRLSMLSLSQNIAIKSKLADESSYPKGVKQLLALQAYNFNKEFNGKSFDSEIYSALFSSYRSYLTSSDYIMRRHSDVVSSVCFNPKSSDLASTGSDGILVVNPKNNLSQILSSEKSTLIYNNIVYKDDGTQLAISCDDNSIHLFTADNISKPKTIIKGLHPQKINDVVWYGNQLITSSIDRTIRIIDVAQNKVIKSGQCPSKPSAIARHGNTLLIGCDDGSIFKTSLNGELNISKMAVQAVGRINSICFNRNGGLFAYGTTKGICKVIDYNTLKTFRNLSGHKSGIKKVAFSPINDFVATACLDKIVRLYNINEEAPEPVLFRDHYSWVLDVKFSPDGKYLTSSGKDKLVVQYLINQKQLVEIISKKVGRNLTQKEWDNYINKDISYQKTIETL